MWYDLPVMASHTAEDIYEHYIKALPAAERLRLLAIVAGDLAGGPRPREGRGARSVMELHGLGREIWQGVDPDAYVERLRGEWHNTG
jgi:hypothetical protein